MAYHMAHMISNLLRNPSFEAATFPTQPPHWRAWGRVAHICPASAPPPASLAEAAEAAATTAPFHGACALEIAGCDARNAGKGASGKRGCSWGGVSQRVPTRRGTRYRLTFFFAARAARQRSVNLRVRFGRERARFALPAAAVARGAAPSVLGGWSMGSVDYVAENATTVVKFVVAMADNSTVIDGVSVVALPRIASVRVGSKLKSLLAANAASVLPPPPANPAAASASASAAGGSSKLVDGASHNVWVEHCASSHTLSVSFTRPRATAHQCPLAFEAEQQRAWERRQGRQVQHSRILTVQLDLCDALGGGRSFEEEVEAYARHGHVHLVPVVGYCCEGHEHMVVYQMLPHGSLRDNLHAPCDSPMSMEQRLRIAVGVAEGLAFMHQQHPPLIHRNLKPSNIMLTPSLQPQIGDFCFVHHDGEGRINAVPEAVQQEGYRDPAIADLHLPTQALTPQHTDVYSFGVILLELLTGRLAVVPDPENPSEMMVITDWAVHYIAEGEVHLIIDPRVFSPDLTPAFQTLGEIASACVAAPAAARPSMDDVARQLADVYAEYFQGEGEGEGGMMEGGMIDVSHQPEV
ncbi:unnamed protein product [Closterium sp. Yama58-4]|nr:unnamed protein product [Closterium sp. Yama58-4]